MNELRERLDKKRRSGEKSFIAFLMAGDPDESTTYEAALHLINAGVDVIEVGVPHSDPVADGPTNQASMLRALAGGMTLPRAIRLAGRIAGHGVPVVLFTYLNPILKMGLDVFASQARLSGVSGVLAVDLPPEEARDYFQRMEAHGLATVFLASPTTTPERLALVDSISTGFVYYVSRAGVTGARSSLSPTLARELIQVRERVKGPLCVGFGISTPEQVVAVAEMADGVVVGSCLVESLNGPDPLHAIERRARELIRPLQVYTKKESKCLS